MYMPLKRKSRPRKSVKNMSVPALTSMMKTVALKQCETKKSNFTIEDRQLYHNSTYYHGGFFATEDGPLNPDGFAENDRNRIGDSIVARGVKWRFWLSNKDDRPNVMYKVFIYLYNTEQTATLSDQIFWRGRDGDGSSMNRMIDAPATNRVKILKSFTLTSKGNYAVEPNNREHSQLREVYVNLNNKVIRYRKDTDKVPYKQDLGIAVVPYDAYGTLTSDNIASLAYSMTLYFKDP